MYRRKHFKKPSVLLSGKNITTWFRSFTISNYCSLTTFLRGGGVGGNPGGGGGLLIRGFTVLLGSVLNLFGNRNGVGSYVHGKCIQLISFDVCKN